MMFGAGLSPAPVRDTIILWTTTHVAYPEAGPLRHLVVHSDQLRCGRVIEREPGWRLRRLSNNGSFRRTTHLDPVDADAPLCGSWLQRFL
jgi:hypothetical protein